MVASVAPHLVYSLDFTLPLSSSALHQLENYFTSHGIQRFRARRALRELCPPPPPSPPRSLSPPVSTHLKHIQPMDGEAPKGDIPLTETETVVSTSPVSSARLQSVCVPVGTFSLPNVQVESSSATSKCKLFSKPFFPSIHGDR